MSPRPYVQSILGALPFTVLGLIVLGVARLAGCVWAQ